MKTLKINISGSVATGKSAFAAAILDLCIMYGIPYTLVEMFDDGDFDTVAQDYKERLKRIGEAEIAQVEVTTTLTRNKEI